MVSIPGDRRAGIDASLVRRLIATQFPQCSGLPVTPVEVDGWDNRTYRLGEDMAVRLPTAAGNVPAVAKENDWLPRLAPALPVAVPPILAKGAPGEGYPFPWSVRGWLPGHAADRGRVDDLSQFAVAEAEFIRALQCGWPAWSRLKKPAAPPVRYVRRYVGYRSRPRKRRRCRAWPTGHSRAALFTHHGDEHAIGIELTPLATRAVFGLPANELANVMVDAGDVLVNQGTELIERLASAVDWKARFALLDEHLTARLTDRAPDPPVEVVEAWRRLTGDPPATNVVASLAKDLGWSGRHLTMRFQQEVGLPPRQLRQVVRVERSSRLLRRGTHRSITEVAVASGYYDHAHMVHEWRSIVGCTPTSWRADRAESCRPLRIYHCVHDESH